METYYDASLTASILVQEVMKELRVKGSPSECCKNGLDKKIFNKCKRIIEKEYSDRSFQEVLKLYISSYFVEDSIEESGYVYEDYDDVTFELGYEDQYSESNNLAN